MRMSGGIVGAGYNRGAREARAIVRCGRERAHRSRSMVREMAHRTGHGALPWRALAAVTP